MNREDKIKRIYDIIGHSGTRGQNAECNIGDVLDWINKYCHDTARTTLFNVIGFMHRWEHKRNPIEDQSDECIDFIYGLIEDES